MYPSGESPPKMTNNYYWADQGQRLTRELNFAVLTCWSSWWASRIRLFVPTHPRAVHGGAMVGRKPSVSKENAKKIIKDFMHHFTNGELPASSDDVWKQMSLATGNKWSSYACHLYLKYDRNVCLSEAKKELGIVDPPKLDENCNFSLQESIVSNDPDVSFESSSDVNNNSIRVDDFDLVLSEMQWNSITTESNGQLKLKPGVWTNEIAVLFWHQYRFPCAFVMKRGEIKRSYDGAVWVVDIVGSCKSKRCGNTFNGHGEKKKTTEGLTMIIKTRDTRNDVHEMVKRPLNGKRRKEVRKELKAEGTLVWRNRFARTNNRVGETEPPILPSGNVCRQARKEQIDDELGVDKDDGKDIIGTIRRMKRKPEYAGLIQEVGADPFFVNYSTPTKLYMYKEYCRIVKNSVISIDATGGVAQKLKEEGQESGYIYLYSIVINFEKKTIAVHQMLSETHTTADIEFWLRKWNIRLKAPKPKQAVCDYSRALLCGMSLAFNDITIKSYVDTAFKGIVKDGAITGVNTLIRVDVAHLIHAVCKWKCWQSVRQAQIKNFYVRCVALMVECTTLCEFQEILDLTCIVGLQSYQDSEIIHSEVQTTKEARKYLERCIAVRGINIEAIEELRSEDGTTFPETEYLSEPEEYRKSSSIHDWVDELASNAGRTQQEGNELNPFYCPEFIKLLIIRAKEFPLWTSVGMETGTGHATSSYVEGYFSQLKGGALKHISRPLRPDKFLKLHAQDIAGATMLFSSIIQNFNGRRYALSIEPEEVNRSISDSIAFPSVNADHHIPMAPQTLHRTEDLGTIEERPNFLEPKSSSEVVTPKPKKVVNIRISDSTAFQSVDPEPRSLLALQTLHRTTTEERTNFPEPKSSSEAVAIEPEKVVNIGISDSTAFPSVDPEQRSLIALQTLYSTTDLDTIGERTNFSEPQSSSEAVTIERVYIVEIPSAAEACCNDSDLMASENWRGKGLAKDKVDWDATVQDDTKVLVTSSKPDPGTNLKVLNHIEKPTVNGASQLTGKTKKRTICERDSKKVTKFFRAYPEIEQENTLVAMKKKPTLLKNGSQCNPLKVPGPSGEVNAYYVKRTCAFDALVHVLMTAALDDVNYFNFLKGSANRTLQFVCNLIENGASATVLRDRLRILKSLYPCKTETQTALRVLVYTINAEDSIANAVKKTLATEPSIANVEKCSRCKGRAYGTTILEPNNETVGRGFGYLKSALNFASPFYRVKCPAPCLGEFTWTREPAAHVLIELDIRSKTPSGELPNTGKRCRLNEMPATLELKHGDTSSIYRLGGIVARVPDHFIAYCLRTSQFWQVYDDLAKEIGKGEPKFVIEPHLAVYIRCRQITRQ